MIKRPTLKQIGIYFLAFLVFLSVVLETAYYFGAVGFSPSRCVAKAFGVFATDSESEFIRFEDVGQGDCTVIKSKDKCAVIDFGNRDSADKLYWKLKKSGISEIDFAVVTHWHEDHLGGLCDIMEKMTVKNIIISETFANDCDEDTAERFYELVGISNTNILKPEIGMNINAGNAAITVVYRNIDADKENNRSLITKVDFHNLCVLITGDAESEIEADLINSSADIKADILKLGHHGSNTSTSEKFLQVVKPRIAVASCGYNNSYNHPSDKTVDRVTSLGIKYYRTDLDGSITVNFENDDFYIITERQEEN